MSEVRTINSATDALEIYRENLYAQIHNPLLRQTIENFNSVDFDPSRIEKLLGMKFEIVGNSFHPASVFSERVRFLLVWKMHNTENFISLVFLPYDLGSMSISWTMQGDFINMSLRMEIEKITYDFNTIELEMHNLNNERYKTVLRISPSSLKIRFPNPIDLIGDNGLFELAVQPLSIGD